MVSPYGPSVLSAGIGLPGWARASVRPQSPLALAQDLFTHAAKPVPAITPFAKPAFGGPSQDPAAAGLGRFVDLRATQIHTVDDASLTVHTAEGDTITLTSHREMNALKARLTYAPGDAPATSDAPPSDGVTRVGLREFQLDERVTVSVQGDLSETELADLRKLVSRLGDSLHEAQDDDHEGPQPLPAVDMRGLDSLSDFALHVEHTEDITRLHVRRLQDAPSANGPAPAADRGPRDPWVSPGRSHDANDSHDVASAWLLRLLESLRAPAPALPPSPNDPANPPGPAQPEPLGA